MKCMKHLFLCLSKLYFLPHPRRERTPLLTLNTQGDTEGDTPSKEKSERHHYHYNSTAPFGSVRPRTAPYGNKYYLILA
jgi:hypothetical protein